MKKRKELSELTTQELEKRLRDNQAELLQLRLKKQTGQLEKPHLLKTMRRDNARIQTLLRQKKAS